METRRSARKGVSPFWSWWDAPDVLMLFLASGLGRGAKILEGDKSARRCVRVVIRRRLGEQIVDVGVLGSDKKEDDMWHVPHWKHLFNENLSSRTETSSLSRVFRHGGDPWSKWRVSRKSTRTDKFWKIRAWLRNSAVTDSAPHCRSETDAINSLQSVAAVCNF